MTRHARIGTRRMVALACLAATAGSAVAQCDFTLIPASPVSTFAAIRTVYDTVRNRTLLMENSFSLPMRLYAWNGSAWVLLNSSGPPRAQNPAMAFDSARDRLVVYGGFSTAASPFPPEVWEWDGTAWSTVLAAAPVVGRYQHGMVYDAAIGRIVMFGGINGYLPLNDTWLWDGAMWTEVPSAVRPPARTVPQLAYDSNRGRVMLYGPSTTGNSAVGDVWEFDGAIWTQRTEAAPWRSTASIAYDPVRSKLIMIEGSVFAGVREAWDFDAAVGLWSLRARTQAGVASPRSLLFDPSLGHVVYATGSGLSRWDCESSFGYAWIAGQPVGGSYSPGTSAALSLTVMGTPPFTYQWYRGGQPLNNGGTVSGVDSSTLWISNLTPADGGTYTVTATNAGGSVTSTPATINIFTGCGNTVCYANCDQSTACPVLTPNDFMCYFNHFAIQDAYSNCDGSTSTPTITANDFQCYLNAYAAGCS